ncbi:type II toxin-antitoxin system VapC family toxin [Sphingomonas sp. AP4-R1]|uniref:type II toxin-antitoxin system VapC family toxin n=1 Tax=Sphingomonas sp. AP4-R1 TaxID=2735134 RepID=UPI0014939F97|nr:type II toxin-antitoxin system VapC family toxin [Sphingomonas sp. AP4-R1]QJU56762.1 type II toxin-antitoxin system VapC family toxin [Sphingomonas sp. AP4-R1]
MKYLFDSNILIAAMMAGDTRLQARMAECDEGDIVTSAVVYAEVAHGCMHGKQPALDYLDTFVEEVAVLPFDRAASVAYARLPFVRGSYDRLIAAHALSLGLTLITANERDFADVPDLQVENWMLPPDSSA